MGLSDSLQKEFDDRRNPGWAILFQCYLGIVPKLPFKISYRDLIDPQPPSRTEGGRKDVPDKIELSKYLNENRVWTGSARKDFIYSV